MPRDERVYLRHIADAISRINDYVAGVSERQFRERQIVQSAVIRELEVIGEAARNLSEQFRSDHPEVGWLDIVAMRNRLIHAYFDVDLNVVWEVVRDDLPGLDAFVRRALARTQG
jgi:uncharacterized protein with HEPN domain